MPPPLLRVRDLTLRHGSGRAEVTATDRVGFALSAGERLVLLGPSGCGKSSLLNAVAGFVRPALGSIELNGRPVAGPGPDRMMVFQEFDQLLPWRTVHANVALPLRLARGLDRAGAARRATELLATVGLRDFADAYPHTLSGGMKQRVAIARALAMRPEVLLMDEPFAALDALSRRRMQDELTALWRAFRFTLLFVTHAIDEAILVGSRVIVLSARPGRIVADLDVSDPEAGRRGSPRFGEIERHIQALLLPEANEAAERAAEEAVDA